MVLKTIIAERSSSSASTCAVLGGWRQRHSVLGTVGIPRGRSRQPTPTLDAEKTPLRPWIATLKPIYVRVIAMEITGRRFKFGPEPDHETIIG